MKPIHVVVALIRLFAICLTMYALSFSINIIAFSSGSADFYFSTPWFLLLGFTLAISLICWNFPVYISRKLTATNVSTDEETLSFKGDEFLSICIFSLAMYFLYSLVGETAYWINIFFNPAMSEVVQNYGSRQAASLWSFGIRIIFVIFLFIGNGLIVKIYRNLRDGG